MKVIMNAAGKLFNGFNAIGPIFNAPREKGETSAVVFHLDADADSMLAKLKERGHNVYTAKLVVKP